MTRPSHALALTAVVLGCTLGSAPAAAEETKPIQSGAASGTAPAFKASARLMARPSTPTP